MQNTLNDSQLQGKTLLLVGTGTIKKKHVLQKLSKMPIKIIALNKEKNWAKDYVDEWILADNSNHIEAMHALKEYFRKHPNKKIDGAFTTWEDDVLLCSKICDKYGFVGIPLSISKKVRNKYAFREFCSENGIPFPKNKLIQSDDDIKFVLKNLKFPLVVKPTYGTSSAFVVKAETKEDLLRIYDYVKSHLSADTESALTDGYGVMIEEYIDGDEVDIDMLVQNGKVKFASITDNHQTEEPFFIETGFSIPTSLPDKDQKSLLELAEETLEKLGVQNACVHFEAKSTKKGPVPIEVNLRMGGDEVYTFVKGAWGVDLIENAVKIALGIYIKPEKTEEPKKYMAGHDFLVPYSGILVKLGIDEKIYKKKYLEQLNFYKDIGDPVLSPPDGYEYMGWMTVSGDNILDAKDNLADAMKYVKYEIAKFSDDSSVGKTSKKDKFSRAIINKNLVLGSAKIENIRRLDLKKQKNLHIGITYNLYDSRATKLEQEMSLIAKNIEQNLMKRGYAVDMFDLNNFKNAFNQLSNSKIDLVFNVCERLNNTSLLEPNAASVLDILNLPYTGSNPLTLSLCMDKIRVKKLLTCYNIPTPKWDYAYDMDDKISEELKYPLIVKPSNTDDSIGITNSSVVKDRKELQNELEKVIKVIGRPAIVEEYIEGDEYDVCILGSDNEIRVLPLSKYAFADLPKNYWHIYTYGAKWDEDKNYKKIKINRPPKNISPKLESLLSEVAIDTYNILGCLDYGRVEFRVDKNGNPYVIELNPNPGLSVNDCLPAVAKIAGFDYGDLVEEIIRLAINRYKNKPPYYHLQKNMI